MTLIVSVILIYLLFKLYTLTRRWMPTCLYRKEAPTTPIEVSHALGPDNQENTATSSNVSSESSLKVDKPTRPTFKGLSTLCGYISLSNYVYNQPFQV